MVIPHISIIGFDKLAIGIDFLFILPEIFIAIALSSLLVFGACASESTSTKSQNNQTAIFRDVVSSLSI